MVLDISCHSIYGNSGNAAINIHKDNFISHNLFCFKYRSSDENKCLIETFFLVIGMELPNQPVNFVLFSMSTLSFYHTIFKKTENNVPAD